MAKKAMTKKEYLNHLQELSDNLLKLQLEMKRSDHNGWLDTPPPVGTKLIWLKSGGPYPQLSKLQVKEILNYGFVLEDEISGLHIYQNHDWLWMKPYVASAQMHEAKINFVFNDLPKPIQDYLLGFEVK